MVTTVAIISGSIIGVILLVQSLFMLYRHAKSIPIIEFFKEVVITIFIISAIVFGISMWIIFTDIVGGIVATVVVVVFIVLLVINTDEEV